MKFKFILFATFLIGLLSCEKSNLKKPTQLDFAFKANTETSSDINVQSVDFLIDYLSVSGNRLEGADIYFERQLTSPIQLEMDGVTTLESLKFDIPQGDYTELNINFSNANLSDASPSISINGKYKLTNGPTVDVIFELMTPKLFSILVDNVNQNNIVTLDKKINRTVLIDINVGEWLNTITTSQLDNADLIIGNSGQGLGNSTILINPTNNVDLFNLILGQIENGNTALIK